MKIAQLQRDVPTSFPMGSASTHGSPPTPAVLSVDGPKLPSTGPDRDLAIALLTRLGQSGPTGRYELQMLNQAHSTVRFRDGSGAEYSGTVEDGDNTITIGRASQNDVDYAMEVLGHETGHQIYSMLHLEDVLRANDINPDNGAARLINEAFASAYGNQVRKDVGRSPDLGHGSNLREDYLRHVDPNSRLGKFYIKAYDIDVNDPEFQNIRDVKSLPALRALVPVLQQAGIRDEYLLPGLG